MLTTTDARILLGISDTTFRRRKKDGYITPVPRNQAVQWAQDYYRREDVERLRNGYVESVPAVEPSETSEAIDNTD